MATASACGSVAGSAETGGADPGLALVHRRVAGALQHLPTLGLDQQTGVVQLDDGRTLVLDSLFDHPVEPQHILKYEPIYSANLNTQWGHIVTKKIRVSFLDQVEKRASAKARVFNVSTQEAAPETTDDGGASFEGDGEGQIIKVVDGT